MHCFFREIPKKIAIHVYCLIPPKWVIWWPLSKKGVQVSTAKSLGCMASRWSWKNITQDVGKTRFSRLQQATNVKALKFVSNDFAIGWWNQIPGFADSQFWRHKKKHPTSNYRYSWVSLDNILWVSRFSRVTWSHQCSTHHSARCSDLQAPDRVQAEMSSRIWDVHQMSMTSWWFQPIWKILVKMGIFPK